MGFIDAARMDVAAVLDAAHRYDTAAGMLDTAAQRCLSTLTFGGARAGREYGAEGTSVRHTAERAAAALRDWSRNCREVSAQLRASATEYLQVDDRAARRIG